MNRDQTTGRDCLALLAGILLSCVDVLGIRSQKGSSNLKSVKPFGNWLIALKGGGGESTLMILQVENLSHKASCKLTEITDIGY